MEPQVESFKPPYMSFQTFWNFIAELGSKPLPPRIDRSLMGSKSGTDQNNLTAALTTFQLVKVVNGASEVQPRLRELAEGDEAQRKALLADLVREFYPKPLAVSEANDTEAALHDAFRDAYDLNAAETRRKCETFFLHALRVAELPISPHFKQTRPGSGAPGTPKPRKATKPRRAADPKPDGNGGGIVNPPAGSGAAEVVTVDFGDAGSVVLHVDVRWLQLDDDTFAELRKNVNAMKALATHTPANPAGNDETLAEGGAS
jgi:hypothetical protein